MKAITARSGWLWSVAAAMLIASHAYAHHLSFRATELIGATITDEAGQQIGEAEDIFIEDGELSALVRIDQRLVAIPEENLMHDPDRETWTVSMTLSELQAKPEFDEDERMGDAREDGPAPRH